MASVAMVCALSEYWQGSIIEWDPDWIKRGAAARVRAELGADIIKTNYTGEVDTFKEDKGVSCAVVIAGGPQMDSERELLQMVRDSIDAGGRGVSIGRNIFQAKDPTDLVRKIARVVHEGYDVDEAIRV